MSSEPIWRHGKFSFSPAGGLLLSGTQVPLRPQVRGLLELLIAARGGVVSKDEISRALWPHGSPSDDSIARCVMLLRKALKPDGDTIIKTVYGLGVQLVKQDQPTGNAVQPIIEGLLRSAAEMAAIRSRDGMARARAALQYVVSLNPRAAAPYTLLADLAAVSVVRGHREPREGWRLALDDIEKVLRLDPHSARALATRNFALACMSPGDTSPLERLEVAIDVDPKNWIALFYRSWVLAGNGRLREAIEDLDRGLRLLPIERSLLSFKAWVLCCSNDFDAAERFAHDSLKIRADVELLHLSLCVAYRMRGDARKAIEHATRATELAPGDSLPFSFLADALAAAGEMDAARRALAGSTDGRPILNVALTAPALILLGETEAAVRVVHAGRADGCPWALLATCDPRLKPIHHLIR